MKKGLKLILIFILLWSIPLNTSSQAFYNPVPSVTQYYVWFSHLQTGNAQAAAYYLKDLDKFIRQLKLKQRRYKDQTAFLKHVYYKAHRKYLRDYHTPSTMSNLFENGTYDCLTGTALYSMIFEELGIDYDIVETTYHVYLIAHADNEVVLIESTSPLNGFISDREAINAALKNYQQDQRGVVWAEQNYYQPSQQVNNKLTLTELAGLQYYNQAVAAFNQQDLELALSNLSSALQYYPSHRLKEMMVVMLNTLDQDDHIDPLVKHKYLSKYGHLRQSIITAHKQK